MLPHIILFSFFALLATSLYAQPKVTIVVSDMQGERLAYPEISIGDALHRMGSEQGTLEILPQAIRRNDTLTVRYLGYKPSKLLLDSLVLSKSLITVNLEEETYLLDPVTIVSNAFSSEAYFQQRLKRALRPYTHKYFFDLLFLIKKEVRAGTTCKGKVVGRSRRVRTQLDSTSLECSDTTGEIARCLTLLTRITEVSHLTVNAFCDKKERKVFHCAYKGKAEGLDVWEFTVKKQENMPWDLNQEDVFKCMVALDQEGVIKNIKAQFTPSAATESASYLLETEFTFFKEKLVPLRVSGAFIPHADNDKTPWAVMADYTNLRKHK